MGGGAALAVESFRLRIHIRIGVRLRDRLREGVRVGDVRRSCRW